MDERRKNVENQLSNFSLDQYLAVGIMLFITLLIGLNALKIYMGYILVNRSEVPTKYDLENVSYRSGTMTISIDKNENYPMLEIIINGKVECKFEDNNEITISVSEGDVVQINGSMYSDSIQVSIDNSSSNIINYINSNHVSVKENIRTLAIIKM